MNKTLKNWAITALRKASYRWKPRYNVKKNARVATASYICNMCKEVIYTGKRTLTGKLLDELQELKKEFRVGKVNIDHIDPIVPVNGFSNGSEFDFNEYIENLFCDEDKLQVLCQTCHKLKTKKEDEIRKSNKKKEKSND